MEKGVPGAIQHPWISSFTAPSPRSPSEGHHSDCSGGSRLLKALGHVQLDLPIARFVVLNGRGQVQAEAFSRVVGEDDPIAELERFIKDLAEKIGVHSKIDDHFVGSLRDAADIRIAGLDAGSIDLRRGGLGFVGHNPEFLVKSRAAHLADRSSASK